MCRAKARLWSDGKNRIKQVYIVLSRVSKANRGLRVKQNNRLPVLAAFAPCLRHSGVVHHRGGLRAKP